MEVALKICVLVTDQKFPLFVNITHFLASGHEISPSEYDKQGRTEVLCTGEWGSGGAGCSPCHGMEQGSAAAWKGPSIGACCFSALLVCPEHLTSCEGV